MTEIDQIVEIVNSTSKILIIQADNPDADSITSALALESILAKLGKNPVMYCGVDMPAYLKYLSGWDRVESEIPNDIEATIIVDTSAESLLGKLYSSNYKSIVANKPVIVLDHHEDVPCDIPFVSVALNDGSKVSTGELIYSLSKSLGWNIPIDAAEFITTSILADSMGLTTENTTADTYRVIAELIDMGVSRPKLEELRREFNKMPEIIFRYKGQLINKTEIHNSNLAMVVIPQDEINEYSPLYNPGPLIQADHLQTEGIKVSVTIKSYDSGRITGAIRCNYGTPIAAKLANKFGGGGHEYASGFKTEGKELSELKNECIKYAYELIAEIGESNETI